MELEGQRAQDKNLLKSQDKKLKQQIEETAEAESQCLNKEAQIEDLQRSNRQLEKNVNKQIEKAKKLEEAVQHQLEQVKRAEDKIWEVERSK